MAKSCGRAPPIIPVPIVALFLTPSRLLSFPAAEFEGREKGKRKKVYSSTSSILCSCNVPLFVIVTRDYCQYAYSNYYSLLLRTTLNYSSTTLRLRCYYSRLQSKLSNQDRGRKRIVWALIYRSPVNPVDGAHIPPSLRRRPTNPISLPHVHMPAEGQVRKRDV